MTTAEDDVTVDDESEDTPAVVAKLRERLKRCTAEKQEYLDGWQRSRADFANYKREETALHAHKEERIKADFAEALLPAIDAVWFAVKSPAFKEASEQWQTGLQTISDSLKKSLDNFGVEYIMEPSNGNKIDFAQYEIVREVPTSDEKKDNVVENLHRPGLRVGEHVIRPAQVSVFVYNS